jgi:hypothetical protein
MSAQLDTEGGLGIILQSTTYEYLAHILSEWKEIQGLRRRATKMAVKVEVRYAEEHQVSSADLHANVLRRPSPRKRSAARGGKVRWSARGEPLEGDFETSASFLDRTRLRWVGLLFPLRSNAYRPVPIESCSVSTISIHPAPD